MATMLFTEGETGPTPVIQKQLLCHVVDGMAKARPQALYAEFPYLVSSYDSGFRRITYAMFANAIDGLSRWIYQTLGPGQNFPTLAYMGPNDLRYNALILAAVKTGYKVLLTSPRNSIAAHENLFNLLDCRVMIAPNPQPPEVSAILEKSSIRTIEIPSVETLINEVYPKFPYKKTFAKARTEPLVVLHTSGTTGLPKPIIWTHDYAASFQNWLSKEPPMHFTNQSSLWTSTRLFVTLPPFHAGSLFMTFIGALFNQTSLIYPITGVPPSAKSVADGLKHTKADCALLASLFIDELAGDPDLLTFFAENLNVVCYAGGSVSQSAGDMVSKKIDLLSVIGSTEAGVYPTLRPVHPSRTENWNYFHFHPESGITFQRDSEDQYEAVIMRDQDPDKVQPVFHIFPNLQEWRTRDLYTPHPTIPHLWSYSARTDDIIVFLTGEKTNPTSMEHHISMHPEVRSALVIGTLRFQAALLIELNTTEHISDAERTKITESIWPTIEAANAVCPRHAKVDKSYILFTAPNKPMKRAAKGTIQRQPTLRLYTKEIQALYADTEEIPALDLNQIPVVTQQPLIDPENESSIESFIRNAVTNIIGSNVLLITDDLFNQRGMDSLQALSLTRVLKQAYKIPDFSISTVYTHPSIQSLAEIIGEIVAQNEATRLSALKSTKLLLERTLAEYTDLTDNPLVKRTVVLTGSYGALGCYFLEGLLNSKEVSHVYCMNHVPDSHSIQISRSKARNLPTNFPASRVTFLQKDLSKEWFGLGPDMYREIHESVTEIIHSAWIVNFNLSLVSFKPNLLGVTKLVEFAASAPRSPSLMFISSVSSVGASGIDPVPEEVLPDVAAPLPMGYAQSKYLAERILDHAARLAPSISIKIARIGQIAGPANSNGSWNKQEWFPSLVLSSLHLKMIPDSLGKGHDMVDWVPIDILASSLIELASKTSAIEKQHDGAVVLHPMNPKPTPWTSIIQSVISALSDYGKKDIALVPFNTWLQHVRSEAEVSSRNPEELKRLLKVNPAIKLLSFYEDLAEGRDLPAVSTTNAVKGSKNLQQMDGIKSEWVRRWVKDWLEGQEGVLVDSETKL